MSYRASIANQVSRVVVATALLQCACNANPATRAEITREKPGTDSIGVVQMASDALRAAPGDPPSTRYEVLCFARRNGMTVLLLLPRHSTESPRIEKFGGGGVVSISPSGQAIILARFF